MPNRRENEKEGLYSLLRTHGFDPTMRDTSGGTVPVSNDAEVFQFNFDDKGKAAPVTASIDDDNKLVIYFGDDVNQSGTEETWYSLLRELKHFAQQHQLSFQLKNKDHLRYDMEKRTHMKQVSESIMRINQRMKNLLENPCPPTPSNEVFQHRRYGDKCFEEWNVWKGKVWDHFKKLGDSVNHAYYRESMEHLYRIAKGNLLFEGAASEVEVSELLKKTFQTTIPVERLKPGMICDVIVIHSDKVMKQVDVDVMFSQEIEKVEFNKNQNEYKVTTTSGIEGQPTASDDLVQSEMLFVEKKGTVGPQLTWLSLQVKPDWNGWKFDIKTHKKMHVDDNKDTNMKKVDDKVVKRVKGMQAAQGKLKDKSHDKPLEEGYYPTGRKSSYSDNIPEVKIILQHSRALEEGERRYRAIEKIFVENQQGERFAVPTNKPGLARVYARHIAEGGTPYDEAGKHITSLCEEYTKMAGFVRATRNKQFNESAQSLVNEGVGHYQKLRESLHKLSTHRGYNNYFESWTPTLMEDDGDTTDLSEMFSSNALDPRIESVMPILRKLSKTITEVDHTAGLAEWADGITDESLGIDEEAKWRKGYSASGHPAGYKHKSGEVGPLGGTFTDEPSGYDGDTKKIPVQKYRDQPDQLADRPQTKLSTTGKPLLPKNAQKNLKAAIIRSKGKHGPVGTLPEGRFTHGPGGVPLDRHGNPIPPKAPKAAKPKAPKAAKPKTDYDKIWYDVTGIISNIFPDGDPADYLPKYCRTHGITYDDIRKAARKNGYKDEYDYINDMKTGDYGYEEQMRESQDNDTETNPSWKEYQKQRNQKAPPVPVKEVSNELLDRYKKRAGAQASTADKAGDFKSGNKRFSGIVKATNKQFANDAQFANGKLFRAGLSTKDLDNLSESAGANFKKFDRKITENLNLKSTNTVELYGIYYKGLKEGIDKKPEMSPVERQLFSKFKNRAVNPLASAGVGDLVSLLWLSSLTIPGEDRTIAKLYGFLSPKKITKVLGSGNGKQLTFDDGSQFPETDGADVFLTQSWNMTQMFSNYDDAEKTMMFYSLEGDENSPNLQFNIDVDTNKVKQVEEANTENVAINPQGIPEATRYGLPEFSAKFVNKKLQSGDWESSYDTKPGHPLEIIDHACGGKRRTIMVKSDFNQATRDFNHAKRMGSLPESGPRDEPKTLKGWLKNGKNGDFYSYARQGKAVNTPDGPGTIVKDFKSARTKERTVGVKFANGNGRLFNNDDVTMGEVTENLDANQKAAGQLGSQEKVGPKGAVGKLVGVSEGLADDFMDMAKGLGMKPRLRGAPEEELARRDAEMARRAAQPKTTGHIPTDAEHERLTKLEAELAKDPNYEMSDDYSVWKHGDELKQEIASLKKRLGVSESVTPVDPLAHIVKLAKG